MPSAAGAVAPKCTSPPLVETLPAAGVSATGATLRGLVNPRGCATTYRFSYGPTTKYGVATPARSAGSGKTAVAAAFPIGGLAPLAVYHFRIVASNADGARVGRDLLFRTGVPVSSVQVASRRAPVRRGFVAAVRLRCVGGTTVCDGALTLYTGGGPIGSAPFSLPANSTAIVHVVLSPRGRRIMRHHRRRRGRAVATARYNAAISGIRLVRTFRP